MLMAEYRYQPNTDTNHMPMILYQHCTAPIGWSWYFLFYQKYYKDVYTFRSYPDGQTG